MRNEKPNLSLRLQNQLEALLIYGWDIMKFRINAKVFSTPGGSA
jgi:hypothetical protein